jgi:transposase InsO family protein
VIRAEGGRYIHAAVDDHSRLAYVEVLEDEKSTTATGFTQRAVAWFAAHGINVQAVMTDNGACYKSNLYHDTLQASGIVHARIPPRQPQINGKVERFNRTLLDEWAYVRVYTSETERVDALADWIHTYNHQRNHTPLAAHPSAVQPTRLLNTPRQPPCITRGPQRRNRPNDGA